MSCVSLTCEAKFLWLIQNLLTKLTQAVSLISTIKRKKIINIIHEAQIGNNNKIRVIFFLNLFPNNLRIHEN